MKAFIGVSAVVIAGLGSPGRALERAALDGQTNPSPVDMRIAETANVELPAARVSGVAGTPIPVDLKSPISGVRFIKIGDFPEQLQLSRGFRLRGAWITSVQDLDNLELITQPGLVKTIKLDVLYFRNNQTPAVAQRPLTVELEPPNTLARNGPGADSRSTPANLPDKAASVPQPASPARQTRSAEQENDSLARGATLMRNGDIAAARLLYEDLAISGSAKGARALAETFDPVYLKSVFVAGLQPNLEKARIWYERAAELGDTVSISRLSALDRR
jgi:hypothetical protein